MHLPGTQTHLKTEKKRYIMIAALETLSKRYADKEYEKG